MSKPSRSQRKDIRQKAVRTLERADSVPPERAAEVRARASAVLAATKPRPSLPTPPTPPSRSSRSSVSDDEPVSARAASVSEKASKAEASAAKRKRMVNRAPLLLLGLVVIAFLIVFAAQRGSQSGADDKAKPEAVAPAALKPIEAPRLPDDPSPPTVVVLPSSEQAAPAPAPSASAAPGTTASAAFSAAASAAFAEATAAAPTATAKASAAPKPSAEPAAVKKPAAPAEPAAVKKPVAPRKPPVSNDPY